MNTAITPSKKVEDLVIGDKVDLESCPYLKRHPMAEHEYAVVVSVGLGSLGHVVIGYEGINPVEYPVGLVIGVREGLNLEIAAAALADIATGGVAYGTCCEDLMGKAKRALKLMKPAPSLAAAQGLSPFTVLLLYPDSIAANYGEETYLAHVDAATAAEAQAEAQREAWEASAGEDEDYAGDSFFVLAVFRGHLLDLKVDIT